MGKIIQTTNLAQTANFDLLGEDLGQDVKSAIKRSLSAKAIFPGGNDALSIFRKTLADSIRDIENHPRGLLFQQFLSKGPYEDSGAIPLALAGERLSDNETASAISFIYSHMVNSFKGALAELLASAAVVKLAGDLMVRGALLSGSRVYVGDSVMIPRKSGKGVLKGADLYILNQATQQDGIPCIECAGVAEVKSGCVPIGSIGEQLNRHILRSRTGLRVGEEIYPPEKIRFGSEAGNQVLLIVVRPDDWKLPRTFRFENTERGRLLYTDQATPPLCDDLIENIGDNMWRITLKWSMEALAAAAYEMTFWYMEKVGEVIYSARTPLGWEEMSPAEAGRNAVKMMLYYAILRCRNSRQRAIALYNSYSFGYTLGMNFKDAEGRREMLWPEDLDEISTAGMTKRGFKIW